MSIITYFEIQASKPAELKDFYEKVFGWTLELDPNLPVEYYRIHTPSLAGGLLKRPADVLPTMHGTNAFTCSIQVDSFDQTAEKILSMGGKIAMEKFAVPGRCWQGYFMDPDHNVFGLFEIDENAA